MGLPKGSLRDVFEALEMPWKRGLETGTISQKQVTFRPMPSLWALANVLDLGHHVLIKRTAGAQSSVKVVLIHGLRLSHCGDVRFTPESGHPATPSFMSALCQQLTWWRRVYFGNRKVIAPLTPTSSGPPVVVSAQ
jgi:hypothetical protein